MLRLNILKFLLTKKPTLVWKGKWIRNNWNRFSADLISLERNLSPGRFSQFEPNNKPIHHDEAATQLSWMYSFKRLFNSSILTTINYISATFAILHHFILPVCALCALTWLQLCFIAHSFKAFNCFQWTRSTLLVWNSAPTCTHTHSRTEEWGS